MKIIFKGGSHHNELDMVDDWVAEYSFPVKSGKRETYVKTSDTDAGAIVFLISSLSEKEAQKGKA